ncbi:MAG: aromatic amino acid hydroxylase [Bdellovibrionales bacterium]|nr:aromatic amino acid hydroxylase [Bdellovibrionales bacterium]
MSNNTVTSAPTTDSVPSHLRRFVVSQNYDAYTAMDQAVWRFIMRQLKNFLVKNAHPCYAEGLQKTGIHIHRIPKISEMSEKLAPHGWKAVAVSGFIPPAAFMELQSLGFLPIACEMRSVQHLTYTPAPDIVHEAAGHAPILIDPEFSAYLRKYAQVARHAIMDLEDLEVYEAIRELSDLKESPGANIDDIEKAYIRLDNAKKKVGTPSEAALLARMNWWTAEYGMIGSLDAPKIFGAGLLSSVGESRSSMRPETKKIPFSLACLDFNYDITEPQPQIFVTKSFHELSVAIEEMEKTMVFRVGGQKSLDKLVQARTVNTIVFEDDFQVSGALRAYRTGTGGSPENAFVPGITYLQFQGPCQLAVNGGEVLGQGRKKHPDGFGCPVGKLKSVSQPLKNMSEGDFAKMGWDVGALFKVEFESGIRVEGTLKKVQRKDSRIQTITLTHTKVTHGTDVLFEPAWGEYDLVLLEEIKAITSGPADRIAFGDTDSYAIKRVPLQYVSEKKQRLVGLYGDVRKMRESGKRDDDVVKALTVIAKELHQFHQEDWLLPLEIVELLHEFEQKPPLYHELQKFLANYAELSETSRESIYDGLQLLGKQDT